MVNPMTPLQSPAVAPTPSSSNDAYFQAKLNALFEAEARGDSEATIATLRRQVEYTSQLMGLTRPGPPTGEQRPAFDEAGKLIRVLNGVQPKPKLGSDHKVPTPQQVEQWVKDIETAFAYAQVLDDSVTRTH